MNTKIPCPYCSCLKGYIYVQSHYQCLNCKRVVDYCCKEYKDDDRIKRLEKGFNPRRIYETLPTSEYTAYSENKG